MKNKLTNIFFGLGAMALGILPGFFSQSTRGCTGICGNCGGTCTGGIVAGIVLSAGCLWQKLVRLKRLSMSEVGKSNEL